MISPKSIPLSAPAEQLLKEAFETDELIKAAMEQVNKLQHRKESIIEELLAANVKEAGNYEILFKERVVRKVNTERFRQNYPVEYGRIKEMEIARFMENAGKNVLLKDAERMLGKDQLDPVCDLQVSVTHVVVKKAIE